MGNILGIDIGGTTIKGGRICGNRIVEQVALDTRADEGGEVTINQVREMIRQLRNDDTTAIGIGVPSVVDRMKGVVYNVQNIRDWEEVHLKAILEMDFHLPVHLGNDANCFAYGEKIFGKGSGFEHFVGITLGTGVGGGIIQQHRLLEDANCGSGEFGEIPYLDSILEEYCGSRFFTRVEGKTAHEVALAALEGDQRSVALWNEYGIHLAAMVKIILLVLDPQAIIFGGAIARSFPLFETAMREDLTNFTYPRSVSKLQILTSELENAGILGAAALCMDKHIYTYQNNHDYGFSSEKMAFADTGDAHPGSM